jgi:hypothetical protein
MLRTVVFLFCVLLASPVRADGHYAEVTWPNLLNAMIRFNAIDLIQDDELMDEYAAITDCDLYKFYFHDDFKWNHARDVMRQSIHKNMQQYTTRFSYDARFKLDRYDFQNKMYRFNQRTLLNNIRQIVVMDFSGSVCSDVMLRYFPKKYAMKLDPPLTIPGVTLAPKEAEDLLNFMNTNNNHEHYIYARINMAVTYVEPARKVYADANVADSKNYRYTQSGKDSAMFVLDAHADKVEFFRDPAMTELVYTFVPQ